MTGEKPHDVVIVGAGATGCWAARALTREGLDVLLLEAGPERPEPLPRLERQPVQSQSEACTAAASHLFVDDLEHPYTTPPDRPFAWIRGRQLGGRLRTWARAAPRKSARELLGWPFGSDELEPHYLEVEAALWVRSDLLVDGPGLHRLRSVAAGVESPRVALGGAPAILEAARATGRLTVRTDAVVGSIHCAGGRARGVVLAPTGEQVHARVVLLCASTIESTRILLASAPGGLANESDLLGRNLMDHTGVISTGLMPGLPPIRCEGQQTQYAVVPAAEAPFHIFCGLQLEGAEGTLFRMYSQGEMRPQANNRVTLDATRTDRAGLAVPHIDCALGDEDRALRRRQAERMHEIAEAAGFVTTGSPSPVEPPGAQVHEVGTARMGDDARRSYLNRHNQCWSIANLFVTDGSCFPSSGWANPTLTMMAITGRACAFIAGELKRMNL